MADSLTVDELDVGWRLPHPLSLFFFLLFLLPFLECRDAGWDEESLLNVGLSHFIKVKHFCYFILQFQARECFEAEASRLQQLQAELLDLLAPPPLGALVVSQDNL